MAARPAAKVLLSVLLPGLRLLLLLSVAILVSAVARVAARASQSQPVATAVRLGGDETDTRFVMDLSRTIPLHAFVLADPYRVVVDIPEVMFRLPPKAGQSGRGLVREFRFGLMMKGESRIVLDVRKPVRVAKAFVMTAAAGNPARLVLELVPTDRQSFLRQVAIEEKLARAEQPAPAAPPPPTAHTRPLVVLDPGHGGIDSGTIAPNGVQEKNIVLAFAKVLRAKLEADGKCRVLMTRTRDVYVPLEQRVRIARAAGADLFVSLHANFLPRREGDAHGLTVFTLSKKASNSDAAREAEEENRSDVIAGIDLKSEPTDVAQILFDLAQRETKIYSIQFARALVGDVKGVIQLHKPTIESANFQVLRDPDVPSALVELGYVSDPGDLRSLTSPKWQKRAADATARAIEAFVAAHLTTAQAKQN
jgi:N-acetylmuramoyl-L-alanine amidase